MSDETREEGTERACSAPGPSIAEILEFARRSKVVNLEVPLGTVLESANIVERVQARGCVVAWSGYVLVTKG